MKKKKKYRDKSQIHDICCEHVLRGVREMSVLQDAAVTITFLVGRFKDTTSLSSMIHGAKGILIIAQGY